ncbi:MAG TPA: glycosyltransferase family 1 protein, partial [Roseimicrobium sp.]|nr:glycosyltransferase family 1 protein [Roseimicrobium sp.]
MTNTPAHAVLIGNYPPDRQQSMVRYHELLASLLQECGFHNVESIRPEPRFGGRFKSTSRGLGKLAGYVDKYLVFPRRLRLESGQPGRSGALFHICDHSNALYIGNLPRTRTVVTCHDLLAVRGGLGDASAYCPASRLGSLLQKKILASLKKCPFIICDSDATRKDVLRLTDRGTDENIRTVHLSANATFLRMETKAAAVRLKESAIPTDLPYLLHVGSELPRKNRAALVKVGAILKQLGVQMRLVFAGSAADAELVRLAGSTGIGDRMHSVINPDHALLNALYSSAHTLVFPSYSEGFGWPPLEAQSSGCPVISSDRTSLPEICGEGALIFDPDDSKAMADGVVALLNPETRARL